MARTGLATEGESMSPDLNPPRWAEALLRSLLRPSDRESISGDLLEEYRAVRRPARGALRANVWYVEQALSVLWHVIQPCVLAIVALTLLARMIKSSSGGGYVLYGSLVQAPGLSLLHAVIYLWAGYLGSQRTRLVKTGMLAAGVTSCIGFIVLFAAAAIRDPQLILAPFSQPFIFVILSVLLSLALSYAVLMGAVGGIAGKWVTPTTVRIRG